MTRSESRRRPHLIGVRLTAAELRDATDAAKARDVTVPELLRGALHILLASPTPKSKSVAPLSLDAGDASRDGPGGS